MFWCQLCLPIKFYFCTVRGTQKYQCVNHYITELHERLQEAFTEAQVQSMSETERQKWYCNRKANAISLEPGDLAKADAHGGGERWRISGRRNCMKWSTNCRRHPFLSHEKPVDWMLTNPPLKLTFSHFSDGGDSSLYGCAGQVGQVHHHHLKGTNSEEWDWGSATECKLSIASPASDRWDSTRVCE